MKTAVQIQSEIQHLTQYGLQFKGDGPLAKKERKETTARVEFLRAALLIVQTTGAEGIEKQRSKIDERFKKYEAALKNAWNQPTKLGALLHQKEAKDYFNPAQLEKQRDILNYICAKD